MESSSTGQALFGPNRKFNGVKIFSATMVNERDRLGEKLTKWMAANPQLEVREISVTQSSDDAFHCLSMTVFFWEEV